MTLRAMLAVFDLPDDVHSLDRMLLLAMADNSDDDGFCFPSVATIARKSGADPSTIKRHRTALIERGLLVRIGDEVAGDRAAAGNACCSVWVGIPPGRRPALYLLPFVGAQSETPTGLGGADGALRGRRQDPPGGAERDPNQLLNLKKNRGAGSDIDTDGRFTPGSGPIPKFEADDGEHQDAAAEAVVGIAKARKRIHRKAL